MATTITAMTFDSSVLVNAKQWAQTMSNTILGLGWLNSGDAGSLSYTGNFGTATITNVAIQNNVLQITFSSATNQFAPGEVVQLTGLTTNTFLNNQFVRITNVGGVLAAVAGAGGIQGNNNPGFTLTSVASSVGSTAVYTGTGFSATANAYQNASFVITGFTNGVNNGTFVCTASTSTTITLYNSAATSETHAAVAAWTPDRTNSTFTALFAHADVSTFTTPGSDTGTVTALYNYNTLQNPPDVSHGSNGQQQATNLGGTFRFRGAFVPVTPTFTNLQTTGNLTTVSFGTNGHGFDLTRAVGMTVQVNNAAAPFTFLNSNPANGWPIQSLTSTTIVLNTGSSPRADIASTPTTAGTANPAYFGGQGTSNPTSDTVTFNGDMYIMVSNAGFFTSTTNTVPGFAVANWKRFMYDMFMSNDTLSSTNKLYFKIYFGVITGTNTPAPTFFLGNASDGQGNITTNYNWPLSTSVPFSPTINATNTGNSQWESDFSGAPGRLAMLLWRGYTATSGITGCPTTILNIERSHDNSGNDTDAYWTIVACGSNSGSNSGGQYQQSILKPGTGGAGIMEFNTATTTASSIKTLLVTSTQSFNNNVPVLPVFPMIGYVGNPLIGCISMKNTDTNEGSLINASFYGTSHPYLMTIRGGAINFGYSAVTGNAAGIRWE